MAYQGFCQRSLLLVSYDTSVIFRTLESTMSWLTEAQPSSPELRRLPTIRELPLHFAETSYKVLDSGTAFYHDFVSFIGRDNVIEVAVALIIGTSFTAVSTSLVSDILTPLLSLVPFLDRTLVNKFLVLRCGQGSKKAVLVRAKDATCTYHTLAEATLDGANTLSYGRFMEVSLQFLFSACSLYLLIKLIQILWHKPIVKETEACHYCRRNNSKRALRCGFCTSWLDGREDGQQQQYLGHLGGLRGFTDTLFSSSPKESKGKKTSR